MNMNNNPTPDQLRDLLRPCNDRAGHHVLWVTKAGDVRLTRLPKDCTPAEFEQNQPDMQLRLETFQAGNDYVGGAAAADHQWVTQLFDWLTRAWGEAQGKPSVVYRDI